MLLQLIVGDVVEKERLAMFCMFFASITFAIMGALKFNSFPSLAVQFAQWGYFDPVMQIVGIIEIVCAFGMLPVSTRKMSSVVLAILMLVAFGTHFFSGQYTLMIIPTIMVCIIKIASFTNSEED